MHTLMIVAGGFVLLGICLLVGRLLRGPSPATTAAAAKGFIPLWLVASLINLWLGVTHAGYTVAQETPIFLVVFLVPAVAALLIWRWASRDLTRV